jgi:hypothetical protein
MHDALRRDGRSVRVMRDGHPSGGGRRRCDADIVAHGTDRVWLTELPKGSDSSSMRDGGR